MISCEHVARMASDYLEHKLGLGGRFAVWSHLLMCSACKAYVEQVRLAREALASLRAPEATPQQVETVLEALRGERGRRSPDS